VSAASPWYSFISYLRCAFGYSPSGHAFSLRSAEAVVMSAGELEHEWAGTPGKLIRDRYKKVGAELAPLVTNSTTHHD
jgi:hypothetical protein